MPGTYLIKMNGQTIGSVMKFAGEPPASRWVAYAMRADWLDPEKKAGFRTRREAIAWLEEEAATLTAVSGSR